MSVVRPRVDLSLPVGYGLTPAELIELVRVGEHAGVDGVTCGELASTDAFALLAAAATATKRIGLETGIGSVLARSPAGYAMGAVTLHELSGGRFTLGIGAGSPTVAGFHGAKFRQPLARVESWVLAIRAALAGETLREWGNFRLRGLTAPGLPIVVAAMNEGMVRLSGRLADGMVLNFSAENQAAQLHQLAEKARADAGVTEPFQTHATVWLYAGSDLARARAKFRYETAPYFAVPTYRRAAVAIAGEDAVTEADMAFRSGGRAAAVAAFPDAVTDALLVAGSASEIADRLTGFAAAGCAGVRLTPVTDEPDSLDGNAAAAELLGDAIAELERRAASGAAPEFDRVADGEVRLR